MKLLNTLFLAGRLFSPLYSSIMKVRASLYEKNIFHVEHLAVPVISVGNLTMGGTGKTPTVRFLAELLQENDFSPAIISRGYGGSAKSSINIVSDGKTLHLTPEEAGDEPFMLASTLQHVPVLTGKKRIPPCLYAVNTLGCDIIILDDGFQHMSVYRDLNIVLFNATTLDGNGRVFPGGELREPYSALNRADLFIMTGVTDDNLHAVENFSNRLKESHPKVPVFQSRISIAGIFDKSGMQIHEPASKHRYYCFCGIAHPERFLASLSLKDVNIAGSTTYSDHSSYSQQDLDNLISKAENCSATALITTEKDIVKIKKTPVKFPLHYLKIETSVTSDFKTFLQSQQFMQPQ